MKNIIQKLKEKQEAIYSNIETEENSLKLIENKIELLNKQFQDADFILTAFKILTNIRLDYSSDLSILRGGYCINKNMSGNQLRHHNKLLNSAVTVAPETYDHPDNLFFGNGGSINGVCNNLLNIDIGEFEGNKTYSYSLKSYGFDWKPNNIHGLMEKIKLEKHLKFKVDSVLSNLKRKYELISSEITKAENLEEKNKTNPEDLTIKELIPKIRDLFKHFIKGKNFETQKDSILKFLDYLNSQTKENFPKLLRELKFDTAKKIISGSYQNMSETDNLFGLISIVPKKRLGKKGK